MKRTLRTVSRLARRTMSALLALVAMTTLPIPVWAEDETASATTVEAKWGTSVNDLTNEGTLLEAINAAEASGSTVAYIQLQAGATTTSDHEINSGTFTLDLNGQTLTITNNVTLIIGGSGTTVTLTDTSTDKNGKVEVTSWSYSAIRVYDGANVIIKAGNYYGVEVYPNSSANISGGTFIGGTYSNVISNHGTLVISDGSFSGEGISSSVQTYDGSTTTITGGDFTEGSNATIYRIGGTFDFTGNTSVEGISVKGSVNVEVYSNILLPDGYCFYDTNNAVTTVLEAYEKYTIGKEPETKYTITYAAGGGTGEMASVISYGTHKLPECTFTAPVDKMFKAWQVGETEYQPGEEITVSANTTVTAVWRDYVPQIVIEMADANRDGWNGDAAIIVKKDGEQIGSATVESGNESATASFDYDPFCEYTFEWKKGTYDSECSFKILIEDNPVFATPDGMYSDKTAGCASYTDGQIVYTIEIAKTIVNIADGDLDSYEVNELIDVGKLTYTRTLNAGWNALFVPFEIPMSELESGYDVAYFNDVHSYDTDSDGDIDNLEMELIKVQSTQTLKANYPYMIRPKSEADQSLSLTLTDATLYKTVSDTVTCSSVFMKYEVAGTYTAMSSTDLDGRLVVTTEGGWAQLNASSTLKPFRLHMKLTTLPGSPVKVLETALLNNLVVTVRLRGESGATGIAPVELLPAEAPAIYDLMGRPVANPVKGQIYIVNGKKVVY